MKVMSQSIENRICRKTIVLFQIFCVYLIKDGEIINNLSAFFEGSLKERMNFLKIHSLKVGSTKI